MVLEMHCHTAEHSICSHIDAASLAQRVFDKGLEGIVITDHNYLWMPEELSELRRRTAVPNFFVILAGQEVSTSDAGHVLVYGADRTIPERTSLSRIRREFPRAAIVWSHPYRDGHIPLPEHLLDPRLDAVEIFGSNHTVSELSRGLNDWHRYKFIAIGGTDTHSFSYAGMYPTIFDHPVATIEDLVAELKAGRCRPFFKEIPKSGATNTRVLELTIGTKGENNEREKLVLKAHENPESWKSGARTFHVMEHLARHGFRTGRFRVPKPLGQDREHLVLIEEGVRGRSLFDRLVRADIEHSLFYVRLAAQWLAKLHNSRLHITPPEEFMRKEPNRLAHYVSILHQINHRHARRVQEIMDTVLDTERALYLGRPERLVQGHGDYHPKNIFIGRDNPDDRESSFVSVIDFNSSYAMPPAFDVGTFLAQFRNQFFHHREVLRKVPEDFFLDTYLQYAQVVDEDFPAQVELFRARTSLSIIYYLVKVGLGDSEDLWRVMVEAEHSLTKLSVNESRVKPCR